MEVATVPFDRAFSQVRCSIKEKSKLKKNRERGKRNTLAYIPDILNPGHAYPENLTTAESSEISTNELTEMQAQLDQLLEEVKKCRPDEILDSQTQQRRIAKKKTIKQLFTVASKFQRNLRRGVYLACILYHEDRVLVTNEDCIPVIEIDETFPSSINTDLHWLMKVSCTWNESKLIRFEMEKNVSSAIHFRTKILSAVIQMQSSLGIKDLGQIYYKPLKDSRGTMVLSSVNYIKSPKSVSLLNSKWLPTSKVFKKNVLSEDLNLSEILMASIQQQINYHQVSSLKLSRGLYLAYFKMQSSVDAIKIVTSLKSPNMLPHCKIRDNPHVAYEEWKYLKENYSLEVVDKGSELQKTFLELVASACKRLFNYMDVNNEDITNHRIYDSEIIYLFEDVSFIVLCPSAELSCSLPAKKEILLQRSDLLSLPIQVFEMIHLYTYKTSITKKYAKLSCILEIDSITANLLHREAFSNTEVLLAKERVLKLQELEHRLNTIWKSVRWLMNVIYFARDRSAIGISIRCILQRVTPFGMSPQTLQVQPEENLLNKSFGRGSWPGPRNAVSPDNRISEFSKSEQNLKTNEYSNYTSNSNEMEKIKNKASLTDSKSENALTKITFKSNPQRLRANTICDMISNDTLKMNPSSSLASINDLEQPEFSNSTPILSSDKDSTLQPFVTNLRRKKSKIVSSKSMINVRQTLKLNKFKSGHSNSVHPDTESNISKSLNNINPGPDLNGEPTEELENKKIFKGSKGLRHPFGYRNESGILQVFAAYETGLASGTSLKLHVTPRTTAREVVDLVIKQLNMAVILKGKEGPVYNPDKLNNFCLVAVIGARERCLRDDFKPLHLQNPWRKGRLYVRQKQDVLAALEHSSRHSTII